MVRNRTWKLRNWFVESRWFSKTLPRKFEWTRLSWLLYLWRSTITVFLRMRRRTKRKIKIYYPWSRSSCWALDSTLMNSQRRSINVYRYCVPWGHATRLCLQMSHNFSLGRICTCPSWTCSKNSKKSSAWPISSSPMTWVGFALFQIVSRLFTQVF